MDNKSTATSYKINKIDLQQSIWEQDFELASSLSQGNKLNSNTSTNPLLDKLMGNHNQSPADIRSVLSTQGKLVMP